MQPLLKQGERIRVKKAENIEAGDVVVFAYENGLLVHRALYIRKENSCCKGDNSFQIERVQCFDVIGRVTEVMSEQGEVMLPRHERRY